MGIWFLMLGTDLLFPVIMLIGGKLFLKNIPKSINTFLGYRTTMSMKNEDTWRFAHAVAGRFWWRWGWVSFAPAVVPMLLLLGKPEEIAASVGLAIACVLMLPLLAVIPHTEKTLRNTFDKDGNRKGGNVNGDL